uniref:Uncharacterized protein n=1 Tax=viral metagenome TaxID=1070528 RepID=A0A6C0FD23_9ZZZZ|tara:strand:- start:2426 stop:2836 length:411 start_codon:yes stop_codon:yes gene_type:complete
MWLLLLLCTMIMCSTFIIKKECFENPKIDMNDQRTIGQKYRPENGLAVLNLLLEKLGKDYYCVYVIKIKRQGAYIKMRTFIQNIKSLAVLEYEILGKIPMRKKGCHKLISYNIVNADENDINGGDINNGMYHKLKK